MADAKAKIDLTEVPVSDMSRIFNRVASVTECPDFIYGDSVQEDDRARFVVSPADPIVRDELRQVVLSMSAIQKTVCDMNGIPIQSLAGDFKLPKKPTKKQQAEHNVLRERVAISMTQIQQGYEAQICSLETREQIAKCVKVENFKELDAENKLVPTEKSNNNIIAAIPDIFIVWLFKRVQELSNLTNDEVLALSF